MNLQLTFLAHSPYVERPRTRKELICAAGLKEGKFSVLREMEKSHPTTPKSNGKCPRGRETFRPAPPDYRPRRYWQCGENVHMRPDSRQRTSRSRNHSFPGGQYHPGRALRVSYGMLLLHNLPRHCG